MLEVLLLATNVVQRSNCVAPAKPAAAIITIAAAEARALKGHAANLLGRQRQRAEADARGIPVNPPAPHSEFKEKEVGENLFPPVVKFVVKAGVLGRFKLESPLATQIWKLE